MSRPRAGQGHLPRTSVLTVTSNLAARWTSASASSVGSGISSRPMPRFSRLRS